MADIKSPEADKAEVARKVLALPNTATPEEFQELLKDHTDLADELANDPEAFIKKYTSVEDDGNGEPEQAGQPQAQVVSTDDELVEVKLPKKFLGTYKDGETLHKSMKHKDEVINVLKSQLEQATHGQVALKKLLTEHQTKSQQALPVESKVIDIDLPENADLFEEANQKKVVSILKAYQDKAKALEEKLAALEGNVSTVRNVVETKQQTELKQAQDAAEAVEFETARLSSGVFSSTRPISAIEDDYLSFLEKASKALGYDGSVYDAAGQYTEGAKKAFNLYTDEANGATFRQQLQAASIALPDDFVDLNTKSEIDRIRFRNIDGKNIPVMSYDEAMTLYGHKTGVTKQRLEQQALEQRKAGAQAHAKAVQNRKQFAAEVRPSEGTHTTASLDEQTLGQMINTFAQLTYAGKDTTREREMLVATLTNGGMDKAEIDTYLNGFRKKD